MKEIKKSQTLIMCIITTGVENYREWVCIIDETKLKKNSLWMKTESKTQTNKTCND